MKAKIVLISVVSFVLVSCNNQLLDLKPISTATVGNYYNTQDQIGQAVTGIYAAMDSWPVNIYLYMSEIRSNNYYGVFHDAQRDWWDITDFSVNPADNILETVWQNLYQMINRANMVLSHIDNITFTDPALKKQYIAETRFLRAYAYFQLVRLYGNVPLVTKVITPSEGIKIKQSTPADVYKYITSEMSSVQNDLPAQYTGSDVGRATKWAVKGILAKVYMTMAGPPLNQSDKLDSAKVLLKQIIDQEGTYVHFAQNYKDLFTLANENKYDIFEIQFTSGGNGNGTSFPAQVIPSDLNIQQSPYGFYIYASRLALSPDLLSSYNANDKRFNATIDTSYTTNAVPPGHGNTPFFDKFMDPAAVNGLVSNSDWPDNFPLLRYADVMLSYAGIINDQSGPTAEAVGLLNRIRERAGLQDVNPTTKAEFTQDLNTEYRHEFADEGQWWFYLVRTGQAVNVINQWAKSLSQSFQINNDKLIYPIPESQIQVFPDLYKQNPGY